jgi:hypothetical protein
MANCFSIHGGDPLTFLRWLGGFVVLFWLIGILLSIGGNLINILLIVAAIVFVIDAISSRRKMM